MLAVSPYDTAFAARHETGRNVAISGIGDRVRTTAASGRAARMRSSVATRLSTFSATVETRKPWRSGSKSEAGTARQNASPEGRSYQISASPSVMTKTSVPWMISRVVSRTAASFRAISFPSLIHRLCGNSRPVSAHSDCWRIAKVFTMPSPKRMMCALRSSPWPQIA